MRLKVCSDFASKIRSRNACRFFYYNANEPRAASTKTECNFYLDENVEKWTTEILKIIKNHAATRKEPSEAGDNFSSLFAIHINVFNS